ncbi:Glycerate-and formate-dehydrogenase [Lasiodiplodia theobromae]|uniref:Glycerate-and formate-dehydrogenase n=1 Tax=Lasiodiplodia theobromae TaxID=45133 RepID=UPI0015C40C5A|nr:Glycerate-and formate-dehydrogenase [Lasiodiplodia theobromae]KAF4544628.1 Glycerate-and formate-dehydrogenase [Lasiodiplodia theobromae]
MRSYDSHADRPRVLFLGKPKFSGGGIEENQKYFNVDILDASTRTELLAKLPHAIATRGPYHAVVCRLGTQPFEPFDAELLSPLLPQLKIVVSAQMGFNDFDVSWMTSQGIWFCNTRHATGEATADMALFLILAVLRDTSRAEKNFREGRWRQGLELTRDPAGLTLGIVGMGNIGRCLARKAAAFNMRIRYYNRSRIPAEKIPAGASYCGTLEELLQTSDIISLHCPLTPGTTHLMSEAEFGMMKENSYIVNTSRGPIIEDEALIAALESGKIARAGLDVFGGEPAGIHPYFMQSDKVVVQPHMGGLTQGSFAKAEQECFANMRSYFATGRPLAPVNEVRFRKDSFEPESE